MRGEDASWMPEFVMPPAKGEDRAAEPGAPGRFAPDVAASRGEPGSSVHGAAAHAAAEPPVTGDVAVPRAAGDAAETSADASAPDHSTPTGAAPARAAMTRDAPPPRPRSLRAWVAPVRAHWRLFIAGAAVGVLVLAGMLAGATLLERAALVSASDVVNEYLDALSEGRADDANAIIMPDADAASTVLLTDEVYAPSQHTFSFEVGEASVDGAVARVPATLVYPDAMPTLTKSFELRRELTGWRLETSLAQSVTLTGGAAMPRAVSGIVLPELVATGDEPVWMYPGQYEAEAVEHALVSVHHARVIVGAVIESAWAVWTDPSEAVLQQMRAAARERVGECMQATSPVCGRVAPPPAGATWAIADAEGTAAGMSIVAGAWTYNFAARLESADGRTINTQMLSVTATLNAGRTSVGIEVGLAQTP